MSQTPGNLSRLNACEFAAQELLDFFDRNVPPPEDIGTRDDEWLVSITCDDETIANELNSLLNNLRYQLEQRLK